MPQYDRLWLQPIPVSAPPKPVQLGSLKSEKDVKNCGVQLVPSGGCGWGRPKDAQDRGRSLQPSWAAKIQGKEETGSSLLRAKSEHPRSRPGQTTPQSEKLAQAKPIWNLANVGSSSWHKTQQALGLEMEFPELGSSLPKAASWGSNTATPQCLCPERSANTCHAGGPPVSGPGLAHTRSSSAHPAPAFSMGPDQMKISFEHKEQQHAMRERALKRQAEKEAEEAEQRRDQFARAQEKLMLLEQRAKERRMKEKQEKEERRRRELEELHGQESPHLRGWPVDHASSNSRGAQETAIAQGGGPASPDSRGWFIGNARSCPALTEPPAETPPPPPKISPAETPPPPPKISILQHEHRTAANITHTADGGNCGEQHRQDWHEAHQGTGCAGAETSSAAVEAPKLLLSHQPLQPEHRESSRSNSAGRGSSPGWDRKSAQETMGGDTKSGTDCHHQHQHHDNSNHDRNQKQQHKRQMLPEAAQAASVADQPTGCSWSAANQQQQAWSSAVQTWKNSGHLDNTEWQQDSWEERSTVEDEQEAHKHSCNWSRGVNWQQHRAEPEVQQHLEWSGFDWTQGSQGRGRTYYGKQGASDCYKTRSSQEPQTHEQCNGSTWHGNVWQDFKNDHGTQAAAPRSGVGGPLESATAAPAAAAAAAGTAAAQTAASTTRIKVATRDTCAALAAGPPRGRHNVGVGESVGLLEELHAVDGHSHSYLQACSDDEAPPPSGDCVGVAPTAAENCSRRGLRAFRDDETPVNHIRHGLRAFSGACSSDDERVTTGLSRFGLQAFHVGASSSLCMAEGHETGHKDVSEDLSREGLRATACRSRHRLRAFSGGASSPSDGEDQPLNVVAAVDNRAVNRGTAKLRAWKSGSRTPTKLRAWKSGSRTPTKLLGSGPPPLVSGSRSAAVSLSCKGNTATAKEGRDLAAKLFRNVIHPKAAVAVGPQRHQMPHCGGVSDIRKPRAEANSKDVVCISDSLSAADGKAAAQRQPPREQKDSATCESVADDCNLVVGISNASAESHVIDSAHKVAKCSNSTGGVRSYYGRRDAAAVGGVAISWLASVSKRTPQFSQPQTQPSLKQEQPPLAQQLEEAAEVAQDAVNVPDPCGAGGE